MNPSLKRQLLKTFAQMLADIDNPKDAEKFLTDFFSEKELETLVKRLAVAYWLKKGRTKENIRQNLKPSPQEIREATSSLKRGGVKLALKKIEAEEWASVWAEKIRKITKP